MGRRTSHHRDDFITAGLVFVKEHGVAALTARALAEAMGVSHTVMYRHFTNMDDLVQGIISRFYVEMEMSARVGDTPRARLESFIVNVRRTFTAYPNLVGYLNDRAFEWAIAALRCSTPVRGSASLRRSVPRRARCTETASWRTASIPRRWMRRHRIWSRRRSAR